jgi:S-adenosylmethionine-diacylglycerol 3-amino-3-carboxypropyl transferase
MSLRYTFSNEDTKTELTVIPCTGANILSIAGSGARVIPLFLKKPRKIICIDISIEQLYLTEMRVAAIKQLEYNDYLMFLGYVEPQREGQRQHLFESLAFSDNAKNFMRSYFKSIQWGNLIFSGGWERSLAKTSQLFTWLAPWIIKDIHTCASLEEQQLVYKKLLRKINVASASLSLSIFLVTLLKKIRREQTHLDFSTAFTCSKEFKVSLQRAFSLGLINNNFYYSILLTGRYNYTLAPTCEIEKSNFEAYKKGAMYCNLEYINQDILEYSSCCKSELDFISVSNLPDYLSKDDATNFMQTLRSSLGRNGRLMFRRSLGKNKHFDSTGFTDLSSSYRSLLDEDKTTFYKTEIYSRD